MVNQKRNYSENENTNGKMSNDGKRIEAFNQHTSELHHSSDDCKDFNEKRCMKCIRNAAELGLAPAQFILGECYEFGEKGFKQNKKKAAKWYRKAAEQNMPEAERKLGYMYLFGEGVKKDREKAKEWFFKAAIHGEDEGLDMLLDEF